MHLGAFSSADVQQAKHNETENCVCFFYFYFFVVVVVLFCFSFSSAEFAYQREQTRTSADVSRLHFNVALCCFAPHFHAGGPFSQFFPPPFKKIQNNDPLFSHGRRKRLTLKCVSSYCFHLLALAGSCHKSSYFPGSVCIPSLPVYSPSIKHLQH